ncbi:uncharacterized protein E0L32_004249 [Thyridium curvatum]|uniref:Xylanolytic transcriptional activator regulatory domain-containing protein n=1 Tax=Thyridium curvatum TaxID=1093900 RepID=A0A507BF17_9PEZI|nr:uncharacterized protein E0L32_004249 [Thyridium curvatum]TPX15551.1 hypothetical protein E0L32_004249 [Thyridium curvatum]
MDLTNCPTLHKASVLADWNRGQLDTNLLKVLCATGLGYVLPQQREAGSVCQSWVAEAQRAVLDKLGRISLAGLHTVVLLIKFHYASHTTEDTWILISIAARLTLIKGLNYEQSPSATSPVQQECLRRLIWSIFYLDKIFSGGIDDLSVLPTSAVHVRLPCNDRRFQRGLSSSSPFLQDVLTNGPEDATSSDMDVLAYRMILFDIRHRVLAYTRRVKRQDSSLAEWEPELLALSRELERFGDTLPEELQAGEDRLMFMCHSKDGTAYITLYTMLYMCRCDLHRFVIPGIRESASSEALANTPPEYINRCQKTCLDNAIKLCDFWSSVYRLDPPRLADFTINVVSMYQCIKVIDRLAHLLPQDGEHDLENIKQKLQEALSLASQTRLLYPRIRTWFFEVERLIPLLGQRRRPSLTPAASDTGEANPPTSARVVLGSSDHPDSSTNVFDSGAWTRHWIATGTGAASYGAASLAEMPDFPPNIVSYDNLLPNRELLATDFHDPGAALNVPFGLDLPASPFDLHLGAYGDAEFHPLFYGGCQTQEPER